MIEDGGIMSGWSVSRCPASSKLSRQTHLEKEGDGAHRLASPRLRPSRAERTRIVVTSENARRMNTNTNVDASLV